VPDGVLQHVREHTGDEGDDERGLFLQSDPSVGYRLAAPGEGD
jgi:hypothetical protein